MRILFILLCLFCASTISAQTLDMSSGVLVHIKTPIDNGAFRLIRKIEAAEDVMNIIITTPGGSIQIGSILISAMQVAKARGVKIRCVVPMLAASMGIHILAACDERYALPYAFILFHEPATYTNERLTPSVLKRLRIQLKLLVRKLERDLRKELGISKKKFNYLNQLEYLYPAVDFKYLFPGFNLKMIDNVILPENIELFDYRG